MDSSEAPPGQELAIPTRVIEYRVLQRGLIKRLDLKEPGALKIARRVGSTVFTTGKTWKGPRGGDWVELDHILEKPGWLLIEGPGFGLPGPLLRRVDPSEEAPLVLSVNRPNMQKSSEEVEYHEFVVSPHAKMREAKQWIGLLFSLEPRHLMIAQPRAVNSRIENRARTGQGYNLVSDSLSVREAGYRDGDEVHYTYVGDIEDFEAGCEDGEPAAGYDSEEETGAGPQAPPEAPKAPPEAPKAKPPPEPEPQAYPELEAQFKVLGLPTTTLPNKIKRHYYHLALENHPDKHPDDVETATKRFQEIMAAYDAIRDRLRF